MLTKHIDPAPPLDVIKKVWEMIAAKQFTDLELWANVGYLVSWALQFLSTKIGPDGPVFGTEANEEEFCSYCAKIYDWAADGSSEVQRTAIGGWLVKAMLIALLDRLIRELAVSGIPDWLAEILNALKQRLLEL